MSEAPAPERPPSPGAGGRLVRPPKPLFLERGTYRRRRVMDAARLLPVFGAAMFLVPVFWRSDHSTATGAIYLFVIWLGIIVAAGFLARKLSEPLRRPAGPDADPGPKVGAGAGAATAPRSTPEG